MLTCLCSPPFLAFVEVTSGDGWSHVGRPLCERYVWPYAFFVAHTFIVMFGLLNLIVAAIVDANIAAREEDARVKLMGPSIVKKKGYLF